MVKIAHHPIFLRGFSGTESLARPAILQRSDQEFLPAILEELATEPGRRKLHETLADKRDSENVSRLFQPVHRTFHVVLVDVSCQTFGTPRLDPDKIESAGLVVRRIPESSSGGILWEQREGWMKQGHQIAGWVPLEDPRMLDDDPEPERRRPEDSTGIPAINRLLSLRSAVAEPFSEIVSPLFVAPPDVCEAAKRTVLYGIVPVTSSQSGESENVTRPPYDADKLRLHLHRYLKAGDAIRLPRAGERLVQADTEDARLTEFLQFLRQLAIELDAFGTSPTSQALYAELDALRFQITAPGTHPRSTIAGAPFLHDAVRLLVEGDPDAPAVTMPYTLRARSGTAASRIYTAVEAALVDRLVTLKPQDGRFDEQGRPYVLRAFVRVRDIEICPPRIIWSEDSEFYRIAPWYDSSGAPPVEIPLPDPLDRDFLKGLKPNVAFGVPEGLMNTLLKNSAEDLAKGDGQRPNGGIGLGWICSFSIPIITLCAFIVLSIFLQLFNIIFRWLLFVKICIPYPKPK